MKDGERASLLIDVYNIVDGYNGEQLIKLLDHLKQTGNEDV